MKQHLTGVPVERVSMDIMGPLPKSDSDNKYILLICDYFTKWIEAVALPNQEAKTVADAFVKEFVCRFGVPRRLFTDQGTNLQSALFKEVCKLLEIDQERTTPYHPQSDGLVERMNRSLEAMLSMFVSPSQRDWDHYLPFLMMAYRSAMQETTGYSPNMMMMGREAELPVDLVMGRPEEEERVHCETEYVENLSKKLETVHDFARVNIKLSSDRQKKYYDHKAQLKQFHQGDAVWLHNPARKKGISPKLTRQWEGPYTVITRLSDVTYRIQLSARSKPKIVHFNRLKEYQGADKPVWFNKEVDTPQKQVEIAVDLDEKDETENLNVDSDETILYDVPDLDETVIYKVPEQVGKPPVINKGGDVKAGGDEATSLGMRRSKRTRKVPARYMD